MEPGEMVGVVVFMLLFVIPMAFLLLLIALAPVLGVIALILLLL